MTEQKELIIWRQHMTHKMWKIWVSLSLAFTGMDVTAFLYVPRCSQSLPAFCDTLMDGCSALIHADHGCSLLQLKLVVWSGCKNECQLSSSLLSVRRMLWPSHHGGKCCWSTSQAFASYVVAEHPLKRKCWKKYCDIFTLHLCFKNMSTSLCLYPDCVLINQCIAGVLTLLCF